MELRNVKVQLVICSRKLGDDLPSRFSEIEGVNSRIETTRASDSSFEEWIYRDALPEARGLAKQLADEYYTSPLDVDGVVAIADSILENVADFCVFVEVFKWEQVTEHVKGDLIDAFVAQVTFLKGLLVFAMGTGVELQHLLIHFQAFAINVARVFIKDQHYIITRDADTWQSSYLTRICHCSIRYKED